MFVLDSMIKKQIEYMSVFVFLIVYHFYLQKEEDVVVVLSKEPIECDKEVVVFICQNVISTVRLVGYQIRNLKERYVDIGYLNDTQPNLQFHIIFNPKKTLMCSSCLREEKALTDVTMHSLNTVLFPLETDVISQEVNNSFRYILFIYNHLVVYT